MVSKITSWLLWFSGYMLGYYLLCCLSQWLFGTSMPVAWLAVAAMALLGVACRVYLKIWSFALFILAATYAIQILTHGVTYWTATGIGYTAFIIAEVLEWPKFRNLG